MSPNKRQRGSRHLKTLTEFGGWTGGPGRAGAAHSALCSELELPQARLAVGSGAEAEGPERLRAPGSGTGATHSEVTRPAVNRECAVIKCVVHQRPVCLEFKILKPFLRSIRDSLF